MKLTVRRAETIRSFLTGQGVMAEGSVTVIGDEAAETYTGPLDVPYFAQLFFGEDSAQRSRVENCKKILLDLRARVEALSELIEHAAQTIRQETP